MEETTEQAPKKASKLNAKNKKIIGIVVGVVVVLLLLAGAYYFIAGGDSSDSDKSGDDAMMEDTSNLPELTPEEVGLEVTVRNDNLALMFELTKADDIERVEYTIEYEAEVEDVITNQGIFGLMNIAEDGITETDFREFGTCSAGKCRYDDVVSDVTVNLKVTKTDGNDYRVTKVVKLESSDE